MLPLKKIASNKGMTNDAIIAIYFNVSIQSEWSIVNIFVVGKMCHLERSPSHCVVVQVPVCVCVCGNAKYQNMDNCCLAYFKPFIYAGNTKCVLDDVLDMPDCFIQDSQFLLARPRFFR